MRQFYPIGTPGKPWGDAEKAQWLASQHKQRSYQDDVLVRVEALRASFNEKGLINRLITEPPELPGTSLRR